MKPAERLGRLLPQAVLLGIDERTAMINAGPAASSVPAANSVPAERWQVSGQGSVTLYRAGRSQVYPAGQVFDL